MLFFIKIDSFSYFFKVLEFTCAQAINYGNIVLLNQCFNQIRSDKACAACNEYFRCYPNRLKLQFFITL